MPLDAAQLADLIDAQAATLRLWVRSRCASPEDAVQEAFCRLASQEPPPDNPVAWLYQVCRNLADKQRRTDDRRRSRETVHAQRTNTQTNSTDTLELAETVAAVAQLEPNLQEVLVARIWGGLSLEDVAKLCGVSTATACRRYQAALAALQTILKLICEKP
jgi:RNA polymerase sigma-70 factor (ECF subfamily)